jgi:hypothetical protein
MEEPYWSRDSYRALIDIEQSAEHPSLPMQVLSQDINAFSANYSPKRSARGSQELVDLHSRLASHVLQVPVERLHHIRDILAASRSSAEASEAEAFNHHPQSPLTPALP